MNRKRGPMNKNWIRGVDEQGEWARNHEAVMVKASWRKSSGRARKVGVLTWGDLASDLKGSRASHGAEREVSRGHSRSRRETSLKDRTQGRA